MNFKKKIAGVLFLLFFTRIFYILFYSLLTGRYNGRSSEEPFVPVFYFSTKGIRQDSILLREENIVDMCKSPAVKQFFQIAPTASAIFYSFEHTGVCLCSTPKAASTSVERALLMIEYPENARAYQRMPGHRIHVQKGLKNASAELCFSEGRRGLLVTRNPYARLYSAYIDKFFLAKFHRAALYVYLLHSNKIDRQTYQNLTNPENSGNKNPWDCVLPEVTFEQFLLFIVKSKTLDPHLAPVSLLCKPCQNHFEFTLKQENLESESKYFVDALKQRNIDIGLTEFENYSGDAGVRSLITSYYNFINMWLYSRECSLNMTLYDIINKRLWNALKILGYIDENLLYMEEIFRPPPGVKLKLRNPEAVVKEFQKRSIPVLDLEQQNTQKRKFMNEAYRSVDREVIQWVQRLFKLDFHLFGYEIDPPD